MRNFIFIALFVFTVSTVLGMEYDEDFARYKLWPMASAAYGDDPSLCVNDNFANAEVRNCQCFVYEMNLTVQMQIHCSL